MNTVKPIVMIANQIHAKIMGIVWMKLTDISVTVIKQALKVPIVRLILMSVHLDWSAVAVVHVSIYRAHSSKC